MFRISHTYLFARLEDIALENVRRSVSGNVAEYLQILRVVGNVEYSANKRENKRDYELMKKNDKT
jgi:hypothetical protein